jgi:hypothetical protein
MLEVGGGERGHAMSGSPELLSAEGMRNLLAALERGAGRKLTKKEIGEFSDWLGNRVGEMECLARIASGHKGTIAKDDGNYSPALL